jgi:hypothetical protein
MLSSTKSDRKPIWHLIVPMAILALVLGSTLGMVWHQHVDSASDTCPICHMSHQAVEASVADVHLRALVLTDDEFAPQPISFPPSFTPRLTPPRGPPAS